MLQHYMHYYYWYMRAMNARLHKKEKRKRVPDFSSSITLSKIRNFVNTK